MRGKMEVVEIFALFKQQNMDIQCIILCTISLTICYVSQLFCAHLCAVPNNSNCNDEKRILGK